MQELVFDPLDMKRTTFDPTIAMTYPLAQAHVLLKEGTLHVEHRFGDNSAYYPSGSAYSTVLDLCNFAMIHLHQGCFRGKSVLSPQSVTTMHTPFADEYVLANSRYGLTFKTLRYKGLNCIEHNGEFGTFGSHLTLVPDRRLACVLMLNRTPSMAASLVHWLLFRDSNAVEEEGSCLPVDATRFVWARGLLEFHVAQDGSVPEIVVLGVYTLRRI
jgi:Beta-lactamase class C and other penicillin binding proteins